MTGFGNIALTKDKIYSNKIFATYTTFLKKFVQEF